MRFAHRTSFGEAMSPAPAPRHGITRRDLYKKERQERKKEKEKDICTEPPIRPRAGPESACLGSAEGRVDSNN
jgi:hypothetical protein